ncbi:MAG: hypothetical protein HC936_16390 [Leptolyngbyaceae cyanobacterium SU_3_3]|nr:hypothetical protein [Leptolyngbyaceae cyanobacterium SU_3_3]
MILNADRDANGAGAIVLNLGAAINSNGGNIILGGGTDPERQPATGTSTLPRGVQLTAAALDSSGGNVSINGAGFRGNDNNNGVSIIASDIKAGSGNVRINGLGNGSGNGNNGIQISGTTLIEAIESGSISLTGRGADQAGSQNRGINITGTEARLRSTNGTITLTGAGGNGIGSFNHGVDLQDSAIVESVGSGIILLNGTSGSESSNSFGLTIRSNANIQTNTGEVSLRGNSINTSSTIFNLDRSNFSLSSTGDLLFGSATLGGGSLNLTSTQNLNIFGDITTNGGAITLDGATINANRIDSSNINGNGGEIRVIARDRITTGVINSSSTVGRGGNILLDPTGDIVVQSINAQGGTIGGNVNIVTDSFFRALGAFGDRNGINASISTAGGTQGGSVSIRANRASTTTPFIVGSASSNGTASTITTGAATRIDPTRSLTGIFALGTPPSTIRIETAAVPPTPQSSSSPPAQIPEIQRKQNARL